MEKCPKCFQLIEKNLMVCTNCGRLSSTWYWEFFGGLVVIIFAIIAGVRGSSQASLLIGLFGIWLSGRAVRMVPKSISIRLKKSKTNFTSSLTSKEKEPIESKKSDDLKKYNDIKFDKVIEKRSFKEGDVMEYHITHKNISSIIYKTMITGKYYLKDDNGKKLKFNNFDDCIRYIRENFSATVVH